MSLRPRLPVLLVEDTASLQMVYRAALERAGHAVRCAATAAEGLAALQAEPAAVVLLDLVLPDRDGLDLMREMLTLRPGTAVVAITANGSVNRAVEAMRAGAHDFLVKPLDERRLLAAVDNACPRGAAAPAPATAAAGDEGTAAAHFVGSSPAMARVADKIRSVARSMATVFVTGESGTGKELCAQAVHDTSSRAQGPFIALNCGAIPSDLLESEVFGHVKGSFTGAISDKQGAAAAADGGTLFLDEICEMDFGLQTKLLRFLQTSTIQPVGSTRPRKVNVRIICATNRDPLAEVRQGRLREDLYYRLYVVPIHMPALRDRGRDVIEIAEIALTRFAAEEGRRFDGLSPEVAELFLRHPWPGNVRQLLNVIRNVVVLHGGGLVTPAMLPDELVQDVGLPAAPVPLRSPAPVPPLPEALMGRSLAEIEQIVIEATIARMGGSVPRAARVLDVSPSTLYRKRKAWAAWPRDAAE